MKIIFGSRRDHYLVIVSVFLITAVLIAGMAGCGPPSQNLKIQTWYDLDAIRDNLGGSYILLNDLDSSTPGYTELASQTANEGKGWQAIATFNDQFTGTFNGQSYEIRDLLIERPDGSDVGLFGCVSEGGVIKNLGVVNATVIGIEGVSGLVALNFGTVSNCYVMGNLTGEDSAGGLVGWNEGTVSNSYSSANVTGNCSGGLVAANWQGTVSDSYSTASVTGGTWVGGLVALNNEGILINSYFTGNVTGDLGVGGLVGLNRYVAVRNSFYDYDKVLINGDNIITIGALFGEDFEEWLANDKFLDVNERLSQENGYYLINDVGDFKQLLALGQSDTLKFKLKNDLDLATEPNFYIPYLAGEFNGNGYKISNLNFEFYFVSHVGLFGYLAPGGKISGLGTENVKITGTSQVGGLVGANWQGTVSDSYSSGRITGSVTSMVIVYEEDVGGLVGANWQGAVSNSYSAAIVSGNWSVGGLTGSNWDGTVSNCYATGSVTGYGSAGGLVGVNGEGAVDNSYSTGSVTGSSSVGGLVGSNIGTVSNSFWNTETSGQAASDGGTGKTTAEMQDIATFSGATWDIVAVANLSTRNPAYIWNIVDNETYPFLSWQA